MLRQINITDLRRTSFHIQLTINYLQTTIFYIFSGYGITMYPHLYFIVKQFVNALRLIVVIDVQNWLACLYRFNKNKTGFYYWKLPDLHCKNLITVIKFLDFVKNPNSTK